MDKLSQLILCLEVLKMEVNYNLELVSKIISKDRDGSRDKNWSKMRDGIVQRYAEIKANSQPKVLLERVRLPKIEVGVSLSSAGSDYPDILDVRWEEDEAHDNPAEPIVVGTIKQEINDARSDADPARDKKMKRTRFDVERKRKLTRNYTYCNLCDKTFNSTGSYYVHHSRYHNPNSVYKLNSLGGSITCKVCSKDIPKEELSDHRSLCVPKSLQIGQLKCPTCNKGFKDQEILIRHLRQVHVERKFECQICHLKFKKNQHLNQHKKEVHLRQKFKCGFAGCKIVRARKCQIISHQREDHSGFEKEPAQILGRSLKYEGKFSHVSGMKKFKCNACGRLYRILQNFKQHYREKHWDVLNKLKPNVKNEKLSDDDGEVQE